MKLDILNLRFFISLILASCIAGTVHAAANNGPQGITVSPAFQQVSIPLGQPSVPIKFTITNHKSQKQNISLSTQDFNTLSETGGLVFVGSNPTELQKKYGLAKWISLPDKQLALAPNQTATINASILNLPSLNPGGHYGALMLSLNSGSLTSSAVNLHPIASSLLFVTKIGGDTHQLSLASVQAKHSIFTLPSSAVLNFYNPGNTHVVPRGVVTIVDARGNLISKGIVNQDSNIILPETYRRLVVPVEHFRKVSGIGKYTMRVDFRFDGFNQYRRFQISFWVIPSYFILVAIGIILIVVFSIQGYKNLRSWRK